MAVALPQFFGYVRRERSEHRYQGTKSLTRDLYIQLTDGPALVDGLIESVDRVRQLHQR